MKKAVVLLSGGIDSALCLALSQKDHACHTISFDYGQAHQIELESAKALTKHYKVPHHIIKVDLSFLEKAALVNDGSTLEEDLSVEEILTPGNLPSSYVPARNQLFLSYASSLAIEIEAQTIVFGPNADDLNFPDCTADFIESFQKLLDAQGLEIRLWAPLAKLNKLQILEAAIQEKLPFELTWSCYSPHKNLPCLSCSACKLRQNAFEHHQLKDPLNTYATERSNSPSPLLSSDCSNSSKSNSV